MRPEFCTLPALAMHVRILIEYALARAKARVTGTRETFLPEARSNPRLCYFDLLVIMEKKTKEISVFIDESGSFESDPDSSRYYMVFSASFCRASSIALSIRASTG